MRDFLVETVGYLSVSVIGLALIGLLSYLAVLTF